MKLKLKDGTELLVADRDKYLCSKCQAPIYFAETKQGNLIMVDANLKTVHRLTCKDAPGYKIREDL